MLEQSPDVSATPKLERCPKGSHLPEVPLIRMLSFESTNVNMLKEKGSGTGRKSDCDGQ